jgi:hypothetical protein
MFKKKYKIVILDSKWKILEKNLKLEIIPRQKEYIWSGTKYYQVINVVHNIKEPKTISIIVDIIENIEIN